MELCYFQGCGRPLKCKKLCSTHYNMSLKGEIRPIGKLKYANCRVEDCKNKHQAKGYCSTHLNHIKKYGKVVPVRAKRKLGEKVPLCCINNCESYAVSRSMCAKHYKRWNVNGSPFVNYKRKYKKEADFGFAKHVDFYGLTEDEKQFLIEMTDVSVHVHDF